MHVTDFRRSFLRIRLDLELTQPKTISQPPPFTLNNARFPIESRCQVTRGEGSAASSVDYMLGSACKTEQVNVRENIWHDPNADMCLVASNDQFLIVKSWDRNNKGVMLSPPTLGEQPERHAGKNVDAFTDLRIDRRETSGQLLEKTEEIVAAVLENRPLVSQTEFVAPDGSRVLLEYPVKVVNASERDVFYQVDTGPVIVPDAAIFDGTHGISTMRLAFIAHNTLGCTELLLSVPTPIGHGISVSHYSRVLKLEAKNRMIAVD